MSHNQEVASKDTKELKNTTTQQLTSKNKINTGRYSSLAILLFVLIGLFWVVNSYFNIGNNKYTNSAQVESFINPINTRVSAYIKQIYYIEYQIVKKGDTLIVLDNREILTQLGQAEAIYMAALASKIATENSVKTITNNIATVNSNIDAAKSQLWNANENYKRYENLLKDEAVTQQQFDQIKTVHESQRAQYQSLINSRGTASLSVIEVQSRIVINEAEIKRTENALNMAKLNLSYCYITAPHDGIMGRRSVNVGQLLNPSQQVATIVDNKNVWITANFREKQMQEISIGKLASIKVDALEGREFEGKITAISGATGARYAAIPVDNSTGNFVKVQQRIPIRIEFTNNNKAEHLELLRTGMNVEVTIK
ncbi:HlyD family secretion protein [Flavicella sp.]|uniref:HlyD family secretion protein n=1 Tax=Flavicella sp. TaxID=2957742 RepID=UPI003016DB6F